MHFKTLFSYEDIDHYETYIVGMNIAFFKSMLVRVQGLVFLGVRF